MAILQLLTAPDETLRLKSLPVPAVDDNIRRLLDDMLETMYHDEGVGLAAPQVGVLKRAIVIDLHSDDDEQRPKNFYPLYLVNPEITTVSEKTITRTEGCLSTPGTRVEVCRPDNVVVEYLDYNNNVQKLTANGWLSRALQHEVDHLDGRLLVDYLTPLKRDIALRKLAKLKRS